jgi:MFS family permease
LPKETLSSSAIASSASRFSSLAQVLGMLTSGALADRLGIRQLFIICAATVAILASAGFLLWRPRPQSGAA